MYETKPWDSLSIFKKLELLVGDYYGPNPIEVLDKIKEDKFQRGLTLLELLEIKSPHTVLEIGSGMGFQSKAIAQYCNQLTCLDISKHFLLEAQHYCEGIKNIEFVQIEKNSFFPFIDDKFDVILADAVFIHLNLFDIFFYLNHSYRVLKPNGKLYFNAFTYVDNTNIDRFRMMADIYYKHPNSLCELVQWNDKKQIVFLAEMLGYQIEQIIPQGDASEQFILRK